MRRIGVLMNLASYDAESADRVTALAQGLAELGWTAGRIRRRENDPRSKTIVSAFTQVLAELRWGRGDTNRIRALARELVDLEPDIILTGSTAATVALQRETRTIPIVFAGAVDPVAIGLVPRLDRPGGNVTGFATSEAPLGGKWLELLSEIAPGLKRAAAMFNPETFPTSLFVPSLRRRLGHSRSCQPLCPFIAT
jgi:putative ABC transport system substrate-binding protein